MVEVVVGLWEEVREAEVEAEVEVIEDGEVEQRVLL